MLNPCYYHPEIAASGNCIQCGLPICGTCTDRINDRAVCHKCVKSVRDRLEKQMAVAGTGPALVGQGAAMNTTSAFGGASQAAVSNPYMARASAVQAEPLEASHLVLGIVAAMLIGIVGAVILEKIYFYAHFGLSLLYILVGYGVAFGLYMFTKRGGVGMGALAAAIMVAGLLAGQLVLTSDIVNMAHSESSKAGGITTSMMFPILLAHMGTMHWVCIAIGLYFCFSTMARRP